MVTTFSFFLKVYSLLLNINIYAKILHFVKLSLVLMAMELNKENILETCLYLLDTCKLDISPQIAVENLEKLKLQRYETFVLVGFLKKICCKIFVQFSDKSLV